MSVGSMYEDAVDLLQPTVLVSRVCGVCPSALRRLHIPLSNKIYSFILALVFAANLKQSIDAIKFKFNGIVAFIAYLATISDFVRCLVLVVNVHLTCELLIKFFRIMESAQRSLLALNIRQPPDPTKKSQIVWLVVLFSPSAMSVVCSVFGKLDFHNLGILFRMMVITGTACMIRVLLSLVNGKLELLNWHLDDLNNRWPVFLARPPDVSFKDLSCVREWRRTKFVLEREDDRIVTAEKVRNFNKAHLKMIYALKTLKSVFSVTLLAYIVPAVINMSIQIPMVIKIERNTLIYYALGGGIVSEITCLFAILSMSSKAQEQVQKTALLVHDLLDEDRHSSEVELELEQFSMALLHRNATLTAAGFFDVNLKLVARMAGILAPIILFITQTLWNFVL